MKREDCIALDDQDSLRRLRALFTLPENLIYLDGNSLGALPRAVPERLRQAVSEEWGRHLIRGWNDAGWIDAPRRVGDAIGRLIGASPGEVIAVDSTSINLYKVLSAALAHVQQASPDRRVILSEAGNFPTDLYIADSVARQFGCSLRLEHAADLDHAIGPQTGVLMLTEVNYRTGALHDMRQLTAHAHAAGALAIWDLAHSAGVVPIDLHANDVDFAVGCGYKYLNGGPGAPAFVWVHPRHVARLDQPLSGWLGHAAPFAFEPKFRAATDITRYQCGTPGILALTALEEGVATVLAAEPLGGLGAVRAKSIALTTLFIDLIDARCAGHGLEVVTPRNPAQRGSQVSLAHPGDCYAIMQALIAREVIGDFRGGARENRAIPDLLRFGFAPLYTRFTDVWDAVEALRLVLERGEWRTERIAQRAKVT